MAKQSIYERIGGEQAVERLVGDFYRRVLGDGELRPFFQNSSIENLHRMQRAFFAAALGGPVAYEGKTMAEAHHGRGIRPHHLRRFLDHLIETLRDELDEDDVYEIMSRIQIYADEITGTTSVDG